MIFQKRSATILTLAVFAVVLTAGAGAQAAEDETVRRIRDLWSQRQQLWDRIYFECSGTVRWPKGGSVGANPEHSPPKRLKVWVDLSANRVRRERDGELFHSGRNRFCRRFEVFLYDGRDLQSYDPREQNSTPGCELSPEQPELCLRTDATLALAFEGDETPIFFAIGNINRDPKNWRLPVQEGMFSRITTIQHDNRECQVLRSVDATGGENFRELWVDLERDAAVVHETIYGGGKPATQIDVSYQQLHGAWLPSDWSASHLRPDGSFWRASELHVERIDVNVDLSGTVFHMEPAVGMVVSDQTLPGMVRWVLQADGTKKYIELSRTPAAQVLPGTAALAAPMPWYRRWGLVLVNGAVLLGLGLVWAYWWQRCQTH